MLFEELSVGEMSFRGIVRSGNCPLGNCPSGKYLRRTSRPGKVLRGKVHRENVRWRTVQISTRHRTVRIPTKISTLIFEAKYLIGPKYFQWLYILDYCKLIIHCPWNNHFTKPVIFHASCAPDIVNKINPIPTLYSTGNCPKLH